MDKRAFLKVGTGAALGAFGVARAQDSAAVASIVVPYSAGGQTDAMARLIAPIVAKEIGRKVIVANKPGAAALIGTKAVQQAMPDGNNVLFHNSGFVALPMLSKTAGYDPLKDFTPIARVGIGPNFLVVNSDVPARTLPEFIAWAKAQPQGIMAANAGLNSGGHLSTQLFAKRAGIKVTHVPYKGSSQTATAVLTGEVHFQLTSPTEVLTQQAKAGKVRFLGVASKDRSPLAPDLPTIGQTLPGFANAGWFGILGPAGMPAEVVKLWSDGLGKAMAEAEVRERFLRLYMEPAYLATAEFRTEVEESISFWRTIVSELNIKPV